MRIDHNCIFCKIVSGELPRIEVYEDDHTLAFMDINPAANGHVLVIPKQHWENLIVLPDRQLQLVSVTARKVARAVQKVLEPDGITVSQSNGAGAAQSVQHFHFHVIPRKMEDNLMMNWSLVPGDLDQIRAVATRLAAAID